MLAELHVTESRAETKLSPSCLMNMMRFLRNKLRRVCGMTAAHSSDISSAVSCIDPYDLLVQATLHQDRMSGRFRAQWQYTHDFVDVDDIITAHRESLTAQLEVALRTRLSTDLALALHTRFVHSGVYQDLEDAVSLLRDILSLWPPSHLFHISSVINLGTVLLTCFHQTGHSHDIMDSVSLLQQGVEFVSQYHPELAAPVLTELAFALQHRHTWGPGMWDVQGLPVPGKDLSDAIELHRRSLTLRPDHPHRWASLSKLAVALFTQSTDPSVNASEEHPALQILDDAISLYREVLEFKGFRTSTELVFCLTNLAEALRLRFQQSRESCDLNEAIYLHRRALGLLPPLQRDIRSALTNLVVALHTQYENTNDPQTLTEAISFHHRACMLKPQFRPDHSYAYTLLDPVLHPHMPQNQPRHVYLSPGHSTPDVTALLVVGSIDGSNSSIEDELEEAEGEIAKLRKKLVSCSGDRFPLLTQLGAALQNQFMKKQAHDFQDWDDSGITDAIAVFEKALKLRPESHPEHLERSSALQQLAMAKYKLYMQSYDLPHTSSLLDDVISLLYDALKPWPSDHSGRLPVLEALSVALHTRFEHTGRLLDLDEAIVLNRDSLSSLQSNPRLSRVVCLSNLASTLQSRFQQLGRLVDLDETIELLTEALGLCDESYADRPTSFYNIARAFQLRFQHTALLSDLEKAIGFFSEGILCLQSSLPSAQLSLSNIHAIMLSGLASVLQARFKVTRRLSDLQKAVALQNKALELVPENHYATISCLNGLAKALVTMAEEIGSHKDLDEAISLCHNVLRVFGRDQRESAIRCPTLEIIGQALLSRFLRPDRAGDDWKDLLGAAEAFQQIASCQYAPLSQRFSAARMCVRISDTRDDGHGLALIGYRATIELLPVLAGLGVDLETRYRILAVDTDGLSREAAACAIRHQRYDEAIELLEAGRAVFWAQALRLRTPVSKLENVNPDLAKRLGDVSRLLEQSTFHGVSQSSLSLEEALFSDQDALRHRKLSTIFQEILEEVRKQDGFEDFLEIKPFSMLSAAASRGHVVILNASSFRSECHALVLATTPLCIPLRGFTYQTLEGLAKDMHAILHSLVRQSRGPVTHNPSARDVDIALSRVLSNLWTLVVQPILQFLDLKKSDSPPRLWWLATGPFALLPIHAAGIYDGPVSEWVGDYVVSSYTPALSSLLVSPPKPTKEFRMLAAIQPTFSGQQPLPCTKEELRQIEKYIDADCLLRYGTADRPANVKDILTSLEVASIAHFACHGIHSSHPLESALLLEEPLKMAQLMELDMPSASVAFLSACQTAAGNEQLPDEPIHLASTLLFAGFRGAIATMWSIHDVDGPTVSQYFYEYLSSTINPSDRSRTPDYTRAAYALHFAVKKLRANAETSPFIRWAPFIHMGI